LKINKLILVLVLITLFVILGCSNQEKEETVRIGYTPINTHLPLYLSLEEDYFKQEGIDVKLIKFESPNQMVDALIQGNIDLIGPGGPLGIYGIVDFKNNRKLKVYSVVGGSLKNPIANLLVPIDSNITSFQDLKDKKLGIWGGTIQWITITRELLSLNGLEIDKDVQIVGLAPELQVQALATKQVDALFALEPMSTIALEKGVGKIAISGPVESLILENSFVGGGALATKFINENPKLAEKIVGILEKAMKEVNENPDKYKKYLKVYTPLNDDLILKMPILYFKSCEDLNERDIEAIQKFYDIFTKWKVIDGRINPKDLLYC